jgi:hypothetical protein
MVLGGEAVNRCATLHGRCVSSEVMVAGFMQKSKYQPGVFPNILHNYAKQ